MLPKVLFGLSWTLCKAGQKQQAFQLIEEGLEHITTHPNAGAYKFYKELYLFLQAVYKEIVDERKIHDLLSYFEKRTCTLTLKHVPAALPLFLKAAVILSTLLRFIGKC